MTLERQRQILKEKHDVDIWTVHNQHRVAEPTARQRTPRYACCTVVHNPQPVHVYSPTAAPGFRPRTLHNFVAAVTYAKAELARIERLNAAKES